MPSKEARKDPVFLAVLTHGKRLAVGGVLGIETVSKCRAKYANIKQNGYVSDTYFYQIVQNVSLDLQRHFSIIKEIS